MKASFGEKIFGAVNYVLLGLCSLSCLLPLLNICAISLSSNTAVSAGKVSILPVDLNWKSYEAFFKGAPIVQSFLNSLLLTVVGVSLCLFVTLLTAYPLSRKLFYGRKLLSLAIVFTMLFSGGTIPSYLLVNGLGLVNSYWAIWLPGLVSVYNMLIMKNYFENLPEEMEEAARIDGANELQFIWKIIFPLSLPMFATIALFYGVNYWNSFFQVLIYINDTSKYNLTVLVQQMVRSASILQDLSSLEPAEMNMLPPEGVKSAGVFILLLPMVAVYPFIQKYFVKGVMIGAIKG
ncbi:MAG: transporter permease [Paenibacillaceae bacterium]|nr:transporter permease [Paenibacillaceae bacterium]